MQYLTITGAFNAYKILYTVCKRVWAVKEKSLPLFDENQGKTPCFPMVTISDG